MGPGRTSSHGQSSIMNEVFLYDITSILYPMILLE